MLAGHLRPASGFVQAAEELEGHPCPHQTRTQLQERKPGHPTWHPSVWLVIALQNLCNCEKPHGGRHWWQHLHDPRALQLPVGKCNLPHYLHCVYCSLRCETGCSLRNRLNGHQHAIKEKEDTPMGLHFQGKHSVRVSVLASAPNDTTQRRIMEGAWIEQLSSPASPWHLINRDRGIDALTLD